MCPDKKLPPFTLIEGKIGLTERLREFLLMKKMDDGAFDRHRRYTIDKMSMSMTAAFKGGIKFGASPL